MDIDWDRALLLGTTPAQIESTLYSAYGNCAVSTIRPA
jgi:multidrug efflux pump subunit AcrB